jgi:glycosyltransferase involved in cell wall biosynthesis
VMLASSRKQVWPSNVEVSFTVLDDASDDASPEIAARAAKEDPRLSTVRFAKRVGQSKMIQWFVQHGEADCLLSLDADIRFANPDVLWRLTSAIINGADLASIKGVPLPPRSFWERGCAYSGNVLGYLVEHWSPGSTIGLCHGRGIAYGPKMVAALRATDWPEFPFGSDVFVFAIALRERLRFVSVRDAVVLYRAASRPAEFAKQTVQFLRDVRELRRRFSPSLVKKMDIPLDLTVRALMTTAVGDPFGAISWALQRSYATLESFRDDNRWEPRVTTKEIG